MGHPQDQNRVPEELVHGDVGFPAAPEDQGPNGGAARGQQGEAEASHRALPQSASHALDESVAREREEKDSELVNLLHFYYHTLPQEWTFKTQENNEPPLFVLRPSL